MAYGKMTSNKFLTKNLEKMKKIFYLLGLVITVVVIITACQKTSVTEENEGITLKSSNGPSAIGSGTFLTPSYVRHFSFHANTMPQGNVKGNGVVSYNSGLIKIKFDIDCLLIEGNTATMTGVITSFSSNFSTITGNVGDDCWFKVIDNGVGSSSSPDEITFLWYGPNMEDCYGSVSFIYSWFELEGGNIQVNP